MVINMQVRHFSQENYEMLHWNDILTSMYLPLFAIAVYHNIFYSTIGSINNISGIFVLGILELMKYILYVSRHKTVVHKHVKDYAKIMLTVILFFIFFYVLTVLFGAALFSKLEETFLFTLLITTITALPTCLYFGAEDTVVMFLSITSYEGSEIQKLSMWKIRLTLFGAWLGAMVIPLDWNRPWQKWPIPCCVGALCGYTVANWLSSYIQYKRLVKLNKKTGKYAL